MANSLRKHGSKRVQMAYTLYNTEGNIIDSWTCTPLEAEGDANLRRMQMGVGGYIGCLYTMPSNGDSNIALYGNEDGLGQGLHPNKRFRPYVGNIIVRIKR